MDDTNMDDTTSDDTTLDSGASNPNAPNGANNAEQAKDAIIFIPGLSRDLLDQSVDCISRKIVNALDRHARAADAVYLASDSAREEYKEGLKADKRTVVRREQAGDQPFLDVYELDYAEELTKRCKGMKPISQAVALLISLASNIPRLPQLLRGTGKTAPEKFQIIYSMGILGIIAAYAIILLLTAVSSAPVLIDELTGGAEETQVAATGGEVAEAEKAPVAAEEAAVEKTADANAAASPSPTKSQNNTGGSLADFLRNLIVFFTGLGLFTSKPLKEFIKSAAVDYSCAINYLSLGERKRAILGQLSLLVEHVREVTPAYRSIHIISFSFGSLVALDALYPPDEYCRRYDSVASLVTIGCPFDLVRSCWPGYFTGRTNPGEVKRAWLNLYNPVDVLGSNFRNDRLAESAELGIEVREGEGKVMVRPENVAFDRNLHLDELSYLSLLALRGLRVHASYWDPDDKAEICCFDEIIRRLYPNL